jgi:hypothetical protein
VLEVRFLRNLIEEFLEVHCSLGLILSNWSKFFFSLKLKRYNLGIAPDEQFYIDIF